MNKRRSLAVKSKCGEELFIQEGHSMKQILKQHERHCINCSPPPPPPALTRQTAEVFEEPLIERRIPTLF